MGHFSSLVFRYLTVTVSRDCGGIDQLARICRIGFLKFYDVPVICYEYLKMAPIEVKTEFLLGHSSRVHFASDTNIPPQQRQFQPAFTVRKMIYFRVTDPRKLEDSEQDICMTDCRTRLQKLTPEPGWFEN